MPKKKLVRAYTEKDRNPTTIIPDFDHYNTQKRIFSKFHDDLRMVENNVAILIQENLFLVKAPNALFKHNTAPLTEPTVINSRTFQEMQRALNEINMRIVTVPVSTANRINEITGLRETITLRHKDFYNNKCFIFAILEAFIRFNDQLRVICPIMPETVPKIIDHFTTTANDDKFLTDLAHHLDEQNVLMSLWDLNSHPTLKYWAESPDDDSKQQRLINLVIGLFKDALEDYKRKETFANEITILLFAYRYNLKINVIPTRATPALTFNQFDQLTSKDKVIEIINWGFIHFDLLVRTKLPTEEIAVAPCSSPSASISTSISNPLPPPALPSQPLGIVPTESATMSAQPKAPTTIPTNETSNNDLFNCPTIITNHTPNICLAPPDDYHHTTTYQPAATESTHIKVSQPLPVLPHHLIKRLGPNRSLNEGSLPPNTANDPQTPTPQEKKVKDARANDHYKARTQKKQPPSSRSHPTPTRRNSPSPTPQYQGTNTYVQPQHYYQNKQQFHEYCPENQATHNYQHLPLHNHPTFRLPPNQQRAPLAPPHWNQQQQQPVYGYPNNHPGYMVEQPLPFPSVYNPTFFPWGPRLPPQHDFSTPYSQTQEIVTQTVTALLRNGNFNPYKTTNETQNNANTQNARD